MEQQVVDLLTQLTSPDNATRTAAEQQFNEAVIADPSQFTSILTTISNTTTFDLSLRQSSLLHIKRIVPRYWSPAFDNYVGPTPVSQEVKQFIRESLMKLLCDPDSKIRNGAAYAIVQISAVDYPDEWPTLLDELYTQSTTVQDGSVYGILGSLSVLRDLFDDLVTDEQFFEGAVGVRLMQTCEFMLLNSTDLHVITATLSLMKACFEMLENSDTETYPQRKPFIDHAIPEAVKLLWDLALALIQPTAHNTSLAAFELKSQIYDCLALIANSFSHLFKSVKITLSLIDLLIADMTSTQEIYCSLILRYNDSVYYTTFNDYQDFQQHQIERKEPLDVLIRTIDNQISLTQVLTEFQHIKKFALAAAHQLILNLIGFCILPKETQELWTEDFNEFVTVETGLSVNQSVRESIFDLISLLNKDDCEFIIEIVTPKLNKAIQNNANWYDIESMAMVLYACFSNDSEPERPSFNLKDFLSFLLSFITSKMSSLQNSSNEAQLLISRFILMIPKFLMKYEQQLHSVSFGTTSFKQILDAVITQIPKDSSEYDTIKSSLLLSFSYFNQFIRASSFDLEVQAKLINICTQLAKDAEEDANIAILEALVTLVNIDNKSITAPNSYSCLQLIFSIAFKEASSFAIVNSAKECIEDLLEGIPTENYLTQCQTGLPALFNIIDASISAANPSVEYAAELDLALQLLSVFITKAETLPQSVFQEAFPRVAKLIFLTDDDQLLQSSSEAFNDILRNSPGLIDDFRSPEDAQESGYDIVLRVVSKFLSPELSDSAIINLGDIVVSLLKNFKGNKNVSQYLQDILKAVTLRLASAKAVLTIENLILIFNELAFISPSDTINFLQGFPITTENNAPVPALNVIIPIWLNAFEVMRGYEKILSNIRAFSEIFKLNSPALQGLLVNGDQLPLEVENPNVIITRSMAKKIPVKYEQIPASLKIIKLLIHELSFQFQQADAGEIINRTLKLGDGNDAGGENGDDDDDDGWEELEDVGVPSFDKLKSYVGGDDDDLEAEDRENDGDRSTGEEGKVLLKSFFKECAAKNIGGFSQIYEWLNDEEKKILTEYVVFT